MLRGIYVHEKKWQNENPEDFERESHFQLLSLVNKCIAMPKLLFMVILQYNHPKCV